MSTSVELGGWKVSRTIGIGDRQRVRAGLLQVAIFEREGVAEALEGALDGACRRGQILRAYVSAARLPAELIDHLQRVTMGQARNHDLIVLGPSEKDFTYALERVDIYVERPGAGTAADLSTALQQLWAKHERLHIPHSIGEGVSLEQAWQEFPQYSVDVAKLRQKFFGAGG